MDIPTQTELLAKIDAFCARHDMAETRFGRDAVNNPAFIRGLRDGKSPTLDTLNKVKEFMDRTDAEAAVQAKFHAPIEPREEVEQPLPFSSAPVNPTGASSPTSSSTTARPTPPSSSDSCRCSTSEELSSDPSSSSAETISPTVGSNSLSADEPGRRASIKTPNAPSFFNGTER